MSKSLVSLSVLFLGAAATSQVTSPRGLNATEGNATFFNWGVARRFQQVDYTNAGAPILISSISYRRDGNTTQTAPARTFDLTVDLGHTDFGRLSNRLNDNFTVSRTNVFSGVGVNFPDWSANMGAPGPFDFVVPLPVPFVYDGLNALVIDFTITNSTNTTLAAGDRDFIGSTSPTSGVVLGAGCIATGRTTAFSHTAAMSDQSSLPTPAYGLRLQMGGTNAPPSSAVLAFIDGVDQNLAGVLCNVVHAFPLIIIPMVSQADASVSPVNFQFTYDASLIGGTFITQLFAVDLGQPGVPVVVSNGRRCTLNASATTGQHRCSYGFATPTTATGTHFVGGGMVMLLQ